MANRHAPQPWSASLPGVAHPAAAAPPAVPGLAYLGLLAFCFAATSYVLPLQIPGILVALAIIGFTMATRPFPLSIGGRPGTLLLLYGAFVALSVPTSIWLGRSMDTAFEVAKVLALFLVTVNTVTTRRRAYWLLAGLIILILWFPGIGALSNYAAGQTKEPGRASWHGLYGNANMTALTMVLFLPFAAALFGMSRRAWQRVFWGGTGAVLGTVVVLSKSRAGFLALITLGVVGILISRRRFRVLGVIAAAGIALSVFAPADFAERIVSIFWSGEERDASARSRPILWGVALDIIQSRPLTGVGIGTYEQANALRAPPELGTDGGDVWKDPHNTYLSIWAEIGTPGLLAFLGALAALVVRLRRATRRSTPGDPFARLMPAGIAAIGVFFVMGFFNSFQNAWFFYVLFGLLLSIARLVDPAPLTPTGGRRAARRSGRRPVGAVGSAADLGPPPHTTPA